MGRDETDITHSKIDTALSRDSLTLVVRLSSHRLLGFSFEELVGVDTPKQDGRRKWIKLWTHAWLRGPISKQDLATRAIFAGLLALAGDNVGSEEELEHQGMIRVAPGCGFTDHQIAKMLNIREETWLRNKQVLVDIQHIEVTQTNEIKVVEWKKYQADYIKVKKSRAKKKAKEVTNETENVTDRSRRRSKKKEVDEDDKNSLLFRIMEVTKDRKNTPIYVNLIQAHGIPHCERMLGNFREMLQDGLEVENRGAYLTRMIAGDRTEQGG